jgi:diguanylate cyclase (GGDEF)-like protein
MTSSTPSDALGSPEGMPPLAAPPRRLRRDGRFTLPALAAACGTLLAWLVLSSSEPAWVLFVGAALSPLALAGLYRPLGAGGLGLGSFVGPLAAVAAGPPAAATAVLGGAFLCSTVRYRLLRPGTTERGLGRDRRGAVRRAADAAGLAALAWCASLPLAGAIETAPFPVRELVSVALYAGGARVVERLPALGRRPAGGDPPWPREVLGAGWDALGWVLGLACVRLLSSGWPALLPVALTVAGLGVAAGVNAARVEDLGRSVAELERLVALGGTRAASKAGVLAERIRAEIAAIVDFRWLELRLHRAFEAREVLSAGTVGELEEGPARPEPFPRPTSPGIRRRRPWLVVERELRGDDRGFGTVKLWCDPREVVAADLDLLDHLLGQLGGQLERVWLEREAAEDPLTKLARRKILEERLERELARSAEVGASLALVVLDLDRFKAINDRYGHLAGDRALSHVAAVLLSQLGGDPELCCRWGGEEFVVLLPDTSGAEALAVAERLRLAVAATAIVVEGGVIAPTISAGVAATPELLARTEDDLLELADRALYAAKAHGRNRCLRAVGPSRFVGVDGTGYGEEAPRRAAPRL